MTFTHANNLTASLCLGDEQVVVGRLARHGKVIGFEYDEDFVDRGLEISPLRCPLKRGVQTFNAPGIEGLPGFLFDSIPDGWGRLLTDREAMVHGIAPGEISSLDRLSHVGRHAMGALMFEPTRPPVELEGLTEIDALERKIAHVLAGGGTDASTQRDLRELQEFNAGSSGARPKATIQVHKETGDIILAPHMTDKDKDKDHHPWLVKFPNADDGDDMGAVEYVYALMAIDAGVEMAPVRLLRSTRGPGFFATSRFDRDGTRRIHTHSVCGLCHADFRVPAFDYKALIILTMHLTGDMREVEKMYRIAVFNVMSWNRDDHSKNFSFQMDEDGRWRLAPAYDLTFSTGMAGEHSTTIMGEGKNPDTEHMVELGRVAGLSMATVRKIVVSTGRALGKWFDLARDHGVRNERVKLIGERIAVALR